ncbi:MAG: metallophosphoesterase [Planctomycetes bacterium]|nr:metallophosphoesterase [Planctomycetota bacterium]
MKLTSTPASLSLSGLLALGLGLLHSQPNPEAEALAKTRSLMQSPTKFSFTVVGDTQDDGSTSGGVNDNIWPTMAADMNAHSPAFTLFCGDLVAGSGNLNTTIAEWNDWLTATSSLTATRYMVPGNHDMYPNAGGFNAWRNTFPWLPTSNSPAGEEGISYYFDVGNTRVISVTTDWENGGGLPNQSWLDSVLASSASFDHVFVFSHRPIMFSNSEPTGGSQGAFWQSMVQADVTGYFSGHWHRYQPDRITAGGTTWEVVIGTGGGSQHFEPTRPYQQIKGYLLVEVDGPISTATFYGDADGDGHYDDAMDSFVMKQPGPEPQGLVAEYTFEDGTAADTAVPPLGKNIDGALLKNASVGPGIEGDFGLQLDGDGDCVEAGAIGDYNLSINGDLTVSAFARYQSLSGGAWDNTLLCYGTADYYSEDEETNYSYWMSLKSNRTLVAWWEYGDGVNVLAESTLPAPVATGTDHHYCFVRDAQTMTVTFYVDGAQLGNQVAFTHLPTSGARGMLYIGADVAAYHASEAEWNGTIDSVRIHNRSLDADEVARLANPGPNLIVTNAIAGQVTTLSVDQCEPGGSVYFLYSLNGAGPLSTIYGIFDLSRPVQILPRATVNAQGESEISATLPPSASGVHVFAQAIEFPLIGDHDISNPLAVIVQ